MKATALLVEQETCVRSLLAMVEHEPTTRAVRMPEVIDAVMAQIALEQTVLDEPRVAGAVDADRHRAAHLRARLALFRVAASPTDSAAFERSIRELAEIFRDRTRELADAVAAIPEDTARHRIAVELSRLLAAFRAPSSGDYLVAYATKRCALAIDRVA